VAVVSERDTAPCVVEKWVMQHDDPPGCTSRAAARHCDCSRKASNRDCVGQGESLGSWAMDLGMAIPSGLEFFQNRAGGECGGVTVLAQVRQEDMA
jgi:hypothetical protein